MSGIARRVVGSRWWWMFWLAWCAGFGIFDLTAHIVWAAIVMAVELAVFVALGFLWARLRL